jgi:hypothetical protein
VGVASKMTDEEEMRQALDDAVLMHTGRSIGDVASQRVLDEIMPHIISLAAAKNAAMQKKIQRMQGRLDAETSESKNLHELNESQLFAAAEIGKENAALREIAEAVTWQEQQNFSDTMRDVVVVYVDEHSAYECVFCNGEAIRQDLITVGFDHEADCPVTKARALLQHNRGLQED